MSWKEHHRNAERLAQDATVLARHWNAERARHYLLAAAFEYYLAWQMVLPGHPEERGRMAISSARCWMRLSLPVLADDMARRALEAEDLQQFAIDQLREFLLPEEPAYAEVP